VGHGRFVTSLLWMFLFVPFVLRGGMCRMIFVLGRGLGVRRRLVWRRMLLDCGGPPGLPTLRRRRLAGWMRDRRRALLLHRYRLLMLRRGSLLLRRRVLVLLWSLVFWRRLLVLRWSLVC
jgi:hypothetical protein